MTIMLIGPFIFFCRILKQWALCQKARAGPTDGDPLTFNLHITHIITHQLLCFQNEVKRCCKLNTRYRYKWHYCARYPEETARLRDGRLELWGLQTSTLYNSVTISLPGPHRPILEPCLRPREQQGASQMTGYELHSGSRQVAQERPGSRGAGPARLAQSRLSLQSHLVSLMTGVSSDTRRERSVVMVWKVRDFKAPIQGENERGGKALLYS